jgi:hypothetical protein
MRQVRQLARFALSLILVTATGSCDVDQISSNQAKGGQPLLARAAHFKPTNDKFTRLAADVPGFGGLYYDDHGGLVVKLKDPKDLDKARGPVESMLRGGSNRPEKVQRISEAVRGMRAEPAKYELRLLQAWYDRYILPLPRESGVVFSAIGHQKNRIVVGVVGDDGVPRMRRLLDSLPIPRSAIEVQAMGGPLEASSSDTLLEDSFRPVVPGGVGMTAPNTSHTWPPGQCTLGFNLVRWVTSSTIDTAQYYLVNSHCTTHPWSYNADDSTGNATHNDHGGREFADVTHFSVSPCPSGSFCLWVDAAVYKWDQASYPEPAKIAWPALLHDTTVSNSRKTIDDVWDPIEGDGVYKVGIATGRTFGHVKYWCGTAYTDDGHVLLCQVFTDYDQAKGDSGSPVVELEGTSTAAAVGIHRGRYAKCKSWVWGLIHGPCVEFSVFSPMMRIISTMYDITGYIFDPTNYYLTSAPAAPTNYVGLSTPSIDAFWAVISGTATAGPNMTCHWYSGTNLDYTGVEWYADNTYVGGSTDLYYSSAVSFTLHVRYYNTDTGQEAWESKDITVSEGAEQCYDE